MVAAILGLPTGQHIPPNDESAGHNSSRPGPTASATFAAMRPASVYFAYYWFSHRLAAGEANA